MASKYGKATLVIVLFLSVLFLPVSTGFSKPSKNLSSHRKHLTAETERIPGKLVLRSAAAIVEDQLTGECLVRKKAAVALPIASITKLMTAMVVIDANMELEDSINIEAADMDTIRHSHSRLQVGTELTRRDALLLALMASDNRSAHALGRTYQGGLGACVNAMNAKARSLGLLETRFDDPTGLSERQCFFCSGSGAVG